MSFSNSDNIDIYIFKLIKNGAHEFVSTQINILIMRVESLTSLSNISTFYVFEIVKYQNTIQIYRKHSKESRLGLLRVRIDFSSVETVQWPKRLGAG